MKVLFLLPYVFVPPDKGNKHLIFNLLKYVTTHADCDLILLIDGDINRQSVHSDLKSEFPSVRNVWLFNKPLEIRLLLARCRSIVCGIHPSMGRYWNRSLKQWLRTNIGPQTYDIIHFDMFYMAQYQKYCCNICSVLIPSDAYSLSAMLARKATSSVLKKIKMLMEQLLMINTEMRYYRHFDLICPVSKVDAEYFGRFIKRTSIHSIGIAIGDDFVARKSRAFEGRDKKNKPNLLYIGPIAVDWVAECLQKFLLHSYSKVREKVPEACLTVLGRNPASLLSQYFELDESVKHIEFVEDYIDFLERDWVYVHPQRTNAGFQTKVQQAMALGLPVVGFDLAFTGMDVENGKHCYICRTLEEFAEATIALLQDPNLRRKIGLAAAIIIREKYSVKRVGEEMMRYYDETLVSTKAGEPQCGSRKH